MQVKPKQRRRHSAAFKADVLVACAEPGASIAAVALAFKLNDNLVHQWRRGRGAPKALGVPSLGIAEAPPRFIELTVASAMSPAPAPPASPPSPTSETIALEFKYGTLGASVTWPVSAAADCAAWLREVLR